MNRNLNSALPLAAFATGLAVVAWIGFGYAGSNALALVMTLLIGTGYVAGALELLRYRQATDSLLDALGAVPDKLERLGDWLEQLHPSLHNAVRQRVESERSALPAPALAPYLTGLLVLLGMLGTFLGMVVTLKGTVVALESTTDLQGIRASLAAPVKGLGVAFGTSVAGVAASAMLGLMSALCRRQRLQAAQLLDTCIATSLRAFSLAHRRETTLQALQAQAQWLPALVERMDTLTARLQEQGAQLGADLLAGQDRFQSETIGAYSGLATSVERSLSSSLTESARIAGAQVQAVVEGAMGSLARDAAALQGGIAQNAQQQFDALATRFDATMHGAAEQWNGAFTRSSTGFEQGSATLLAGLAQGHAAMQRELAATLSGIAAEAVALHGRMADDAQRSLSGAAAGFEQHTSALLQAVENSRAELLADFAQREQQRVEALMIQDAQRLEALRVQDLLRVQALEVRDEQRQQARVEHEQQRDAQAQAAEQERLATWTQSLQAMAVSLQREWQQAGAQTQAHSAQTLAEVRELLQAAAAAPRAAAEVIAELRQQLSDSIAHDNGLLDERSRIMQTLATLLDAVNHASSEQRAAIDALVEGSAGLLERVGARFGAQVETESQRLTSTAAQLGGSAVEVASLSEAFSHAVTQFGASSDKLGEQMQRIEAALSKSLSRSDEQLAYYVAQAREIIDLSLLSQKQIVEDLQRHARVQSVLSGEAA